jgi:hypothetical protein
MSISKPPDPALVPCPNCGETMNEDDLYCRFCGRPMVATGFDDDGNVVVRTSNRSGGGLRGVGEPPRLPDPQDRRLKREGALARVNGGPFGCTGLAALLIGLLMIVMLIAWFLVRPAIGGAAEDGVENGLARELALHSIAPETTSLTINEVTINEYLDASAAWFDPISNLQVDIRDNEIIANFSVYGLSGSFRSGLTVQDGVIRLVNPSVGGAAGRLVSDERVARAIETQLRMFVQDEGRPITQISLDEGSITIGIGS